MTKAEFKPSQPKELGHGFEYNVNYSYDGHKIKVIPAENREIPEVDLDRIKEILQSAIGQDSVDEQTELRMFSLFLNLAKAFLNKAYICDDFGGDHPARRRWRDKLEKDKNSPFKDIYRNNSLSKNGFSALTSCLGSLNYGVLFDNIPGTKELANNIESSLRISVDEYDKKSTEEKIDYIKNVKNDLYKLLEFLSKGTVAK